MAKRYGTLPSEIAHLDNSDFVFNLLVAGAGIDEEIKQNKKANDRAQMKRRR